jgi:tetratricopeptide (TPR) repeat protein
VARALPFAIAVLAATTLSAPAAAAPSTATPAATVSACDQGRALEDLGRPGDAATAYVKGLADPATQDCANGALAAMAAAGHECDPGRALEAVDRDSDANAAYRKVLAAQPGSACARDGATRTAAGGVLPWLTQAVKDVGTFAAALAVGALLLALVAWTVLIVGTRWRLVRDRRPFRGFRDVRVQIKGLDDSALAQKYGASTTGLMRARLTTDAGDTRIDQASGSASAADTLDGLADAAPQAKVVVALLKALRLTMPKRDWVITGELQVDGGEGVGISLAIDNGGAFVGFSAFWAKALAGRDTTEPVAAYRELTVPAAGWLVHHVASANGPDDLLSTDADSWALTQCGLYWYDKGDREQARRFYLRALGCDGENIAARANLGFLDADEPDRQVAAVRELNRALALLEQRLDGAEAYNQDWYAIKYSRAALDANDWARRRAELIKHRVRAELSSGHLAPPSAMDAAAVESRRRTAFEQTTALALACFDTLALLRRPETAISPRRRKLLSSYVEDAMLPAVLVLLAGVSDRPPVPVAPATFDGDPERVRTAVAARTADRGELVAYVEALPRRDPRVDYNLACLFADDERVARGLLYQCLAATPYLRRRGLAQRALKDPTLTEVLSRFTAADPLQELLDWVDDGGDKDLDQPQAQAAA